jgi:uncharacterized protein YggE
MKRFVGLFVVALIALSVVACGTAQGSHAVEAQAAPPPASGDVARIITVVGVGKVSLVPDIARINVGAEARAGTVSEAKSEIDSQMAAIVAALTELGVADKDIQTSHYSIHYQQEPMPIARAVPQEEGGAVESQGAYRVSSMLQVTVRDVEAAGNVLDAVVEAGANQVYGVTFTVSDERGWESQAREKAVADAKSRAGELARLAGVELGEVVSVSEVIGSVPVPMAMERAFGGGGGIAPGELEMSTQVQVTFAIQ